MKTIGMLVVMVASVVGALLLGGAGDGGKVGGDAGVGAVKQKYVLFVWESAAEMSRRKDVGEKAGAYWGPYGAYAKRLAEAGVMQPGGCCLEPEELAKTVRVKEGKRVVAEGSAGKGMEGLKLGGIFVIEVAGSEEALLWAERVPCSVTGAVEVRPVAVVPGMVEGGK
jgi:hypothetical protein